MTERKEGSEGQHLLAGVVAGNRRQALRDLPGKHVCVCSAAQPCTRPPFVGVRRELYCFDLCLSVVL